MPDGRGRVAAALAAVVLTMVPVASCSGTRAPRVVEGTEVTTSVDPNDVAVPPPSTVAAASVAAELRAAVVARDACRLLDGLRSAVPDLSRPDELRVVYRALRDAVAAARSWVPADIRSSWAVLRRATVRAAGLVEDGAGGVAAVGETFAAPDVVDALNVVDRWSDDHCPPATTTSTPSTSTSTT